MSKPEAPLTGRVEIDQVWDQAISTLPPAARVWVYAVAPLSLHDDIFIVAVQDDLTRAQLETRARPVIEEQLAQHFGYPVRMVVTIDAAIVAARIEAQEAGGPAEPPPAEDFPERAPGVYYLADHQDNADDEEEDSLEDPLNPDWLNRSLAKSKVSRDTSSNAHAANVAQARLNPRYQFDNFVIGASNRFAHAASVAAAEAPGRAYNPLFIHGDSGLGKTHLLHAIGHYVLHMFPSSRVRYVNSEEFVNDVINAIGENRTSTLRKKYREVDVLLIDDIQFIEGKEATQTEFFHTFNALHNENKQIVLTSDRPPAELKTLEDRLRNRFGWGLLSEMLPPDLETRIAILRRKATAENLVAPADVLEFIASKVQTNIRELEGALIRATAFANLNGTTVDLPLAQIVLKDLDVEGDEPEITAALIMAQTASYSEFSVEELCSSSRTRELTQARQIAMYLCRELTQMSLPNIGKAFGGRDHTTVIHADRKIRKLMAENHAVYNKVTELTARIKQQARQS